MKKKMIERRSTTSGESAFVGRSRVRVSHIARLYDMVRDELVAERIQQGLPQLTVEQIMAALEYWREHPEEIETEIAEDEAALARIPSAI